MFSPSVLPPSLRRSKAIEELIPWLSIKGISTGDFTKALQALLVGEQAKGLSANVIVKLKEQWSQEYDEWMQRDVSDQHYVYVWADGIYAKVRLEDDANNKPCLLVLMGATADGHKELITLTIATIPAWTASGRSAHRSMTCCNRSSRGAACVCFSNVFGKLHGKTDMPAFVSSG